jgi:hypothetical protein
LAPVFEDDDADAATCLSGPPQQMYGGECAGGATSNDSHGIAILETFGKSAAHLYYSPFLGILLPTNDLLRMHSVFDKTSTLLDSFNQNIVVGK